MNSQTQIRGAVTGASGLVGRRLMAALGAAGVAVPRAALQAGAGDHVASAAAIEAVRGADVVFHLAALTIVGQADADPIAAYEANVALTWRVLAAAREAGVARVVVVSSDTVYGPDAEVPAREDAPLRPEGPYAASKAAADLLAHGWPAPPEIVIVRFSNVYGPGDPHPSRLVPGVVADVLAGRPPALRGDGSAGRDLLYVDDAVAALLAAARDGLHGEAYNAGTGIATPVAEVAALAVELAGGVAAPQPGGAPPPGEGGRRAVDATKLRDATGWEPLVDLRDGLARTIAAQRGAGAA